MVFPKKVDDSIVTQRKSILSNINLFIPDSIKFFLTYFDIDQPVQFEIEKIYFNNGLTDFKSVVYLYNNVEYVVFSFLSFESIIEEFSIQREKLILPHQKDLVFIGHFEGLYTEGICSITCCAKSGNIFMYTEENNQYFLEDSIYSFFLNLKESLFSYNSGDLDKSKLYKNWGEDFWRVREE